MASPELFAEQFPEAEPGAFAEFEDVYSKASKGIAAQIAEAAQVEWRRCCARTPTPVRRRVAKDAGWPQRPVAAKRPGAVQQAGGGDGGLLRSRSPGPRWRRSSRWSRACPRRAGRHAGHARADGAAQLAAERDERACPVAGWVPASRGSQERHPVAALEQSIVRPRARIIPMDSLRVPYPDDRRHQPRLQQSVRRADRLLGGEEAAALSGQGQPGVRQDDRLEAHKLIDLHDLIPNELRAGRRAKRWMGVPAIPTCSTALASSTSRRRVHLGQRCGSAAGLRQRPGRDPGHAHLQQGAVPGHPGHVRPDAAGRDAERGVDLLAERQQLPSLVMPTGDATTTF